MKPIYEDKAIQVFQDTNEPLSEKVKSTLKTTLAYLANEESSVIKKEIYTANIAHISEEGKLGWKSLTDKDNNVIIFETKELAIQHGLKEIPYQLMSALKYQALVESQQKSLDLVANIHNLTTDMLKGNEKKDIKKSLTENIVALRNKITGKKATKNNM